MDLKRWCFINVILPGALLMDGDNTTDPCVMCHDAAVVSPPSRLLDFLENHWAVVLLVTIGVLLVVGLVLGVHHMRWRRLLREQLEAGVIDVEQYDRLR